jgi:3',5'-cyclic AMP phosphodiesterase CpdA
MAPDAPVTRNDIAAASRDADSRLLLRFIHLTDDHVIDDDGQAVIGASLIDPLNPTFESAMRLQEEYSDEVLNYLEGRINACHAQYPAEFSIVTGDSADLTTVAETRRFIDNLDGTYDRLSAFEQKCRAALPAGSSEAIAQQQCQRFTGRGVADTQSVDPQPGMLLFQPLLTRTLLQLQATETAAATGRAADGSSDLTRQTLTRAPGLPQVLRCHAGQRGCANTRLDVPYYMVFGNHDGYVRGTLAIDTPANVVAETAGRHFMLSQREFIDEFFKTRPTPGPVGHGFHKVEAARRLDADDRNDGY